jgi:hypothetical protein
MVYNWAMKKKSKADKMLEQLMSVLDVLGEAETKQNLDKLNIKPKKDKPKK